ncbi:HPr family phosphocarrier protein [Brevibacillus thermoruber]|uniref:HPr family phosphocarrier protein n=1 Tax=Brevibacillus thermoruber TaxID=33942 RepID=UPI00187C3056|nr:HPr family phosphocarrier protein [Brevibacillus thermoruber]
MKKRLSITLRRALEPERMRNIVASYILIEHQNVQINAKSRLSTFGFFGAKQGETIVISAAGADAEEALEDLRSFLAAE